MAAKTKQTGVRLEEAQAKRLEILAEKFSNTTAGLVRLAVDRLVFEYDQTGELPQKPSLGKRHLSDKAEAAAAAGARQ